MTKAETLRRQAERLRARQYDEPGLTDAEFSAIGLRAAQLEVAAARAERSVCSLCGEPTGGSRYCSDACHREAEGR